MNACDLNLKPIARIIWKLWKDAEDVGFFQSVSSFHNLQLQSVWTKSLSRYSVYLLWLTRAVRVLKRWDLTFLGPNQIN